MAVFFALTTNAYADDIWQMANSDHYGKKAGGMFGRGLVNAASCFVDLAVQTVEKTKDGPPIVGTLGGIGSGAGCTILRAASGVLDVATFWVPEFHGIPVSRSYSNCLDLDAEYYNKNYPSEGDDLNDYSDYEYVPAATAKTTPNAISSRGTTYVAPSPTTQNANTSGATTYVGDTPTNSYQAPVSSAKTVVKDASTQAERDVMKYVKK